MLCVGTDMVKPRQNMDKLTYMVCIKGKWGWNWFTLSVLESTTSFSSLSVVKDARLLLLFSLLFKEN